ncbi:MAG: hypothetical protein ACK5QC_11500 [Bacteroidota bacterium]
MGQGGINGLVQEQIDEIRHEVEKIKEYLKLTKQSNITIPDIPIGVYTTWRDGKQPYNPPYKHSWNKDY